jgi:hypothetical protein
MTWRYHLRKVSGQRSAPMSTIHVLAHVPRMALKSNWHLADEPTLRIFMHRLAELEVQSLPGPVRSRFRAKRLAAVRFYRKHLGQLAEDRLSVGRHINRRSFERPSHSPQIPVQRVHGHLLFSQNAL